VNADFHRKLVEETADVTTIIDPDGEITYVSPSVERTLGYDPEELIGEVGYPYQHPDDRAGVADAIEHVRSDPEETRVVETRFRHADGSWCWIEATIQNRIEDDDIGGLLVNSRDISERKRQEQQYEQLAEEYTTLLDAVEESIFFLDVEHADDGDTFRFRRLNSSYEEQTGISTDEVRGETPIEVFGEDLGSQLRSNYLRCVDAREPISYQEEVPVDTGARFWDTNLAPIVRDGEVTEIVGITRNVTERVERERQLRTQKEQLDEFASVVSHDLRNPLNVASARAEMLAQSCEDDDGHLAAVQESLDRMEAIVSDTLTLARQGQVVGEVESVDLVDIIGSCWRSVDTHDATLEFEDDVRLRADPDRLRHVFENLFRNAVEHGGPDVTVRVGRLDGDGFYVEDTGPGIPADRRERVLDPGHSSESDGTGFGLTIVKRIAEAHGWEMTLASASDGGARFEFEGVDVEAG
jgi:PAS domain S-box-containing protein